MADGTNPNVDQPTVNSAPAPAPDAPAKVAPDATDSSYPFNDGHKGVWGALGGNQEENRAIARAWARCYDRGLNFGPPISDELSLAGQPDGVVQQLFQYAYATLDTNEQKNPNKTVHFHANGVDVGSDSGL